MSKYTTEVRFICETLSGLKESQGINKVEEIIEKARPLLFDFEYPIFDTEYKKTLETKILKHYYTREIGEETVGLWKLRLNSLMNEIMPYYNKLYESELIKFDPFMTHKMRTEHKGSDFDITEAHDSNNGTSNTIGYNLYSDTPQGGLNGLDGIEEGGGNKTYYLTNATKTIDSNASDTRGDSNGRRDGENEYWTTVEGFSGANASDLLLKLRKTFLNIDRDIINDLDVLFMQLW